MRHEEGCAARHSTCRVGPGLLGVAVAAMHAWICFSTVHWQTSSWVMSRLMSWTSPSSLVRGHATSRCTSLATCKPVGRAAVVVQQASPQRGHPTQLRGEVAFCACVPQQALADGRHQAYCHELLLPGRPGSNPSCSSCTQDLHKA